MSTEVSDSSLLLWKGIAYPILEAFILFVIPFKQKLESFVYVIVKLGITILFIVV
jgi:hypothetical protein